MKLNVFVEEVRNKVAQSLGEKYTVTSDRILKNNSVEFDVLMTRWILTVGWQSMRPAR